MAEVNDIAEALRSVVDTALADVDKSSIGGYEPAIDTQKVALMVVPFRQQDTYEWADLSGTKLLCRHTLQLDFWVRLYDDPTNLAVTMQRARDISLLAAKAIATNDGTGYALEPDAPLMASEVEDSVFVINSVAFVRARLSVRVRQEVSV